MVQENEGGAQGKTLISRLPVDPEYSKRLLDEVLRTTGSETNYEPQSRYLVQNPGGKLFEDVIQQAMQKATVKSDFPWIKETRLEISPNGGSTERISTSTPCVIYNRDTNIIENDGSFRSGLEVIFLMHKDANNEIYDLARNMIVSTMNEVLVSIGKQPIEWQ